MGRVLFVFINLLIGVNPFYREGSCFTTTALSVAFCKGWKSFAGRENNAAVELWPCEFGVGVELGTY